MAQTPQVTISEQAPNQLRIDLGSDTFDGASSAQATGLSYENAGSPATSNFATVDISQPDNISTLQASLPGSAVTLGQISDAAGGLDNVAVSAGFIVVAGLDTSHASAGNGNISLTAVGTLTVNPNATLTSGTGTLSLSAGVNADGTGSGAGGPVTVQDSVFTDPNVGNGVFVPDPAKPPWTYAGTAGVSGIGSGFTHLNPGPPDGGQVAYLQEQGSISQEINFAAGSYSLSLLAAQRANDASIQTIQLKVDGIPVGAPVQPSGTSYLSCTENFWVPAGDHTITLAGVDPNGGDNTAFIASVSISNISGTLTLASGSTALSENTGTNAISLRGDDFSIDTSSNPAFVGASPMVGGAPRATLATAHGTDAVAVDAQGNLYVASLNAVQIFAPGSSATTATITGLNNPDGLALDKYGDLFVADSGDHVVDVFVQAGSALFSRSPG